MSGVIIDNLLAKIPDYALSILILFYLGRKIDKLNDALLNHLQEIKNKLD